MASVTEIDNVKNQVGVEIDKLNMGQCRYTYWVPRKHLYPQILADYPGNQGVGVVVPEYSCALQAYTQRLSPMFWRRFGCKRKVNPTDFEKNPQPTKKVASDPAGLREIEPHEKRVRGRFTLLAEKTVDRRWLAA